MKTKTASIFLPLTLTVLAAGCHPPAPPAAVIRMAPEAQTTQLIGEGRLSTNPDYMELTVTIHSQCFATPLEASAANDAAASRVRSLMRSAINQDNPSDGVFTQGGITQSFTRYTASPGCAQTFEKTTTLIMKTSKLAEFPAELARIQKAILGGTLSRATSRVQSKPMTFATMQMPTPRLNYATRERLEKQALAAALESARSKFRETVKPSCGGARHRVIKFLERSAENGRPIPYEATGGSADALVAPEAIWINKTLEVHFEMEGESCRG